MNERSSHLPSLCSIIARWAHRIQENSLLTVYAFIIKGYNSRTVRWKRHTGQGLCPGAHNFHSLFRHVTLPAPACVHQPTSSLNPILLGFLQRLHHKGITKDPSFQFQPFSLLKRMGSGAENLKCVIIDGSFGGPDLIQEPTISHLLEQKTLLSPRKFQEFGSSVSGTEVKDHH